MFFHSSNYCYMQTLCYILGCCIEYYAADQPVCISIYQLMMEKNTLFLEFVKAEEQRFKLQLPARIDEVLEFEQTVIRKDYDKVSKDKTKKRRKEFLTDEYVASFNTLNRNEKVEYYCRKVDILKKLTSKTMGPIDMNQMSGREVEVYVKGFRGWQKKTLRIIRKELCISLQRPGKIKKHDLYNYITRKSKNNEYFSFVLEAINGVPKAKYKTMHLGFTNINTFNEWYEEVSEVIYLARTKMWAQELDIPLQFKVDQRASKIDQEAKQCQKMSSDEQQVEKPSHSVKPTVVPPPVHQEVPVVQKKVVSPAPKQPQQVKKPIAQQKPAMQQVRKQPEQQSQAETHVSKRQSFVGRIMQEEVAADELINLPTEYQQSAECHVNLMQQILPEYDLSKVNSEDFYDTIQYQSKYRLLQAREQPQKFKIFMNFSFPVETVFDFVTNIQLFKSWNTEVEEIAVKTLIAKENTAILYMKIKAYSRIYRARDFVFIRHAFRKGGQIYIIDKSIQNVNFPPFLTIVRGALQIVWAFQPNQTNTESLLTIDLKLDHQGYINNQQNTNLSIQFLKKMLNLQSFLVQKSFKKDEIARMFDVGPPPMKSSKSEAKITSPQKEIQSDKLAKSSKSIPEAKVEQQKASLPPPPPPVVVKRQSKPQVMQKGEIAPEQLDNIQKLHYRVPELDGQGLSIISKSFIKTHYKMAPWDRQLVYETNFITHRIWRDEWEVDHQAGGCWFVNEKKMEEQRKVFSYILSKMGKNLLSGKGILNVSLPVDVFSNQSNLETLAKTLAFAPILLEKAATITQPLQQFKYVVAFGFTASLLYCKMQKPFNPILGETLQCSFRGCPVFLQQVSHHPPVASYYMVGRGYKVYGSIQSKMDLSLNSGTGYNAGDNIVRFDNGTQIRFRTPGGQITGLTFGERKLTLTNKSFYWQPNLGYMLDIAFNPGKKSFWSLSKQQIPMDYFEGTMKRVKKDFLVEFQQKKSVFKPSPSQKDVLEEFYKVHGRWTQSVNIDDKEFFNVEKDNYVKYDLEPNPLPSDCMYREDVVYKRLGNIARSQNEKQRLQVLQRKDRKLRQKHGSGHH